MLIHPSSGVCDLFVELFHGLYCSVRIYNEMKYDLEGVLVEQRYITGE